MLQRLYEWTLSLAARPRAKLALGAISFAESSFFPIPPDALLAPMVLARRDQAWRLAFICTMTSVLGGVFGYLIGALLFDAIAEPLLAFYGYAERFEEFAQTYNEWGVWIVLITGPTPFPFKVITIASGATGLNIWMFIATSIVARGMRFYAVAALLYWFGPPVQSFVEKRLALVFAVALILLVGGFVVARYAF